DLVFWIAKCDGAFDMIFGIYVDNLVAFDNLLLDFMGHFSQNILSRHISNSVYVDIYRRNYLGNQESKATYWGGNPLKGKLDPIMKDILKTIAENSRTTIVELSNKLSSDPRTIISKIKEMEKRKIILGYRILIDLKKIRKESFKAIVYFQNITPGKEGSFKQYCKQNPYICYYIRNIAEWDVELDIEIGSYEEYNKLIKDMKEKFGDIIRTIETVFISEEMKGELNIVQNME
ncbi:MAG: Lrp/AsnC family transcriptional regulator, partial [Nanoarchaeota archaeon]|nr:Lrp/AsnC family transcriptional regulator [Nanoarchaeota archaeon]